MLLKKIGIGFIFLLVSALLHANDLTTLLTGEAPDDKPLDKAISSSSSPRDDRKIQRRLQGIFIELDKLKKLHVAVNKGVVTLTGEVDSLSLEKRAIQYARQVEGVVEVENHLLITKNIKRRMNTALDKVYKTATHLQKNLPLLFIGLLIVGVFWLLGRWLSRRKRLFAYLTPNAFIARLLSQFVRIVLMFMGIVFALILLDATALIGTVLGAAGIIGLAIGFAIRDTVENYIASVLLSLRNPFEPLDWISIEGYEGSVIRLTSRATILMTEDGNHVRIPNAIVFKGIITNYTRNPKRRFSFTINIDPKRCLVSTQQDIVRVLLSIEGVLHEPSPQSIIQKSETNEVLVTISGWVDQNIASFSKVKSEAVRLVGHHLNETERPLQKEKKHIPLIKQNTDVDDTLSQQIKADQNDNTDENLLTPPARKIGN